MINFEKINWLSIKNIVKHYESIIKDIKDGKFTMRNWHKHSLAFPITLIINFLMWFTYKIDATHWSAMPFKTLYYSPYGLFENAIANRVFAQIVIYLIISYGIEFLQGAIYGANKTEAEVFESNKDALFTFSCFMFGILVSELIILFF